MSLVDVIGAISDSVPSGQTLLDAATNASSTQQEVEANIAAEASNKQDQLTTAYESFKSYASQQSMGANAQTSDVQYATDRANEAYYEGIRNLGESVQVAKDLLDDKSNDVSD
jgi:hypothetical protein